MVKQTFNNCAMGSVCADPCGALSASFWEKIIAGVEKHNLTLPLHDQCALLGKCKMEPLSQRCFAYRCGDCKIWHNKKTEFIGAPADLLFNCHVKDKIVAGIAWIDVFEKIRSEA